MIFAPVNERLRMESERLRQSWDQHDAAKLGRYLVSGVEEPRINMQSILTRHFLINLLFGSRLDALKAQELLFGTFSRWLLAMLDRNLEREDWHAILHALDHGGDNAEGIQLPYFLVRAFPQLPATLQIGGAAADDSGVARREVSLVVPHYMRRAFTSLWEGGAGEARQVVLPQLVHTFQDLWRSTLEQEPCHRIASCEAACGSANDYRFISSFGIGRCLDYVGIDISEKNIANALADFPGVHFRVGNVFSLELEDRSVDAMFFHDLLEHLSPEGLEQAVGELCRVTRRSICAGLFSAWEGADHVIRPMDDYHCNTLSLGLLHELFRRHGFGVRPVHIDSYVRRQYPQAEYHNPNAYTLFCDRTAQ